MTRGTSLITSSAMAHLSKQNWGLLFSPLPNYWLLSDKQPFYHHRLVVVFFWNSTTFIISHVDFSPRFRGQFPPEFPNKVSLFIIPSGFVRGGVLVFGIFLFFLVSDFGVY